MKKHSIMVVEDELIVAESLKLSLIGLGYDVPETIGSSDEAVERAEELQPDLILMDIRLEGSRIDGIEAARRIRSRCEIPVIFVTAFADVQTLDRAKTTQPFGYILKPFNEKELWSAIEIALYKHRAEQEIKKRDSILFAISFAVEWFIKNQKSGKDKGTEQGRLEAGIREILEHIGLAVNANSVAIFRMQQDKEGNTGAKIQYIWVAPGSRQSGSAIQEPDHITFTTALWRSLLATGNTIAGDISKFPSNERKFFADRGISSIAILPLFRNEQLWGFVGFSNPESREWSEGEIEALLIAGNIIGSLLE